MHRLRRFAPIAGFFLALPVLAHAHPGHEGHELTWDFQRGFIHPFTGWDHLVAMIAVGLWAAQLGGRARWIVPGAFVITMTLGSTLSHYVPVLPGLESGVAASVLILGLLAAKAERLPTIAGTVVVAAFALFHGFAHGSEMAAGSNVFSYACGFIGATVMLHTAGLGLGTFSRKLSPRLSRYAGWAIAASGVVLLTQ